MCFLFRRSLSVLWFAYALCKFRELHTVFQYGVKQQKTPHEILDCLKGVVSKNAQVECGQALS